MEGFFHMSLRHPEYGEGFLCGWDGRYITVRFAEKDVKFWFPTVFDSLTVGERDRARVDEFIERWVLSHPLCRVTYPERLSQRLLEIYRSVYEKYGKRVEESEADDFLLRAAQYSEAVNNALRSTSVRPRRAASGRAAAAETSGGKGHIPAAKWFSEEKIPLKEIPIEKKVLKSLSEDEKTVVSIATFTVLKKRALFASIVLCAALVAIAIGFTKDPITLVIIMAAVMFGGGFLLGKTARLIDGFAIVRGAQRLGLNLFFRLWFSFLTVVLSVLCFFVSFFYIMFDMVRRNKMTSLPRIVMPQKSGFDMILDYYSAYEAENSFENALDEHYAHLEKQEYERKQRELDDIRSNAEHDEDLGVAAKLKVAAEVERTKKKNDETYKNEIEPRL